MSRITLKSVENQYGVMVAISELYVADDVFQREDVLCMNAESLGLGNCYCHSHNTSVLIDMTTKEVEALGFPVEVVTDEQFIFDCFGKRRAAVEEFCSACYKWGLNPLPELRKTLKENSINIDVVFTHTVPLYGRKAFAVVLDEQGQVYVCLSE